MEFTNLIAFVGLISVPIILAMYLFKQKFKEETFSSLILWEEVFANSISQKPWQKLIANLLLILQLILAILLVFALSRPFFLKETTVSNSLLVVDLSMSMNAVDQGEEITRLEKAKTDIIKIAEQMNENDKLSILIMNDEPYFLFENQSDKSKIIKDVKQLSQTYTSPNITEVKNLLNIEHTVDENIIIFTDDNEIDLGVKNANKKIYGESSNNVAITHVSYNIIEGEIVALIKVSNFSPAKNENSISIFCDDKILEIIDISLNENETKDFIIDNVPPETSKIEFRLTKNDSLEIDNYAYLSTKNASSKEILLVTDKNVFVENVLSVLPNTKVYVENKEQFLEISNKKYDLYVFDNYLPSLVDLPKNSNLLILNPEIGNELFETTEEIKLNEQEITTTRNLSYFKSLDFSVSQIKNVQMPSWADEHVNIGENILAFSGVFKESRILTIAFDFHNSDLPLKKEFPILFYNILNDFFEIGNLGNNNSFLVGETIKYYLNPMTKNASLFSPSGAEIILKNSAENLVAKEVGVYELLEFSNENAITSSLYSVNSFNKLESNLQRNDMIDSENVYENILKLEVPIQIIEPLIMIILAILIFEWWVFNSGI